MHSAEIAPIGVIGATSRTHVSAVNIRMQLYSVQVWIIKRYLKRSLMAQLSVHPAYSLTIYSREDKAI